MIIIIFFLLIFTTNIHTGVIQIFNSSSNKNSIQEKIYLNYIFFIDINNTETNQSLVIYNNNNNNQTMINGNQSLINSVDQNQFAETVVDLLLDLLEKANLSRTVSVIHNDTELTELVERNVDDDIKTNTIQLPLP
jgi:hypothetical protein